MEADCKSPAHRRQAVILSLKLLSLTALAIPLAACGGGGGGSGGGGGGGGGPPAAPTFSLNTQTLTFSADTPFATSPAQQSVTGTVTGTPSGTLFIVVTVAGTAVTNVTNFTISGNSGQASVVPASPAVLGAGTFTSTVTVRACLNDATCATGQLSGSPQTVNVTYTVGSTVPANAVMPHIVTSGTAGQVIIRGTGLSNVSAVSFGSTAATAVTVVSSTEVRASYPATLPAQTLAVTLNGGAIPFSGSIVALAPQTYAAQTLSLPETPERVLAALHDAQRHSLFVAATLPQTGNNKLWRYTDAGGTWNATPEVITIPELRAIALSNDGARLLALTGYSLLELDPASPSAGASRTIAAPFQQSNIGGSPYFKLMAMANDGYAIVASAGVGVSGYANTYVYSSAAGTFTMLPPSAMLYSAGQGGSPTLGVSADGSLVLAAQTGISPPQPVFEYKPTTSLLKPTQVNINTVFDQAPVMDSSASKRVIYDAGVNSVYDSTYALLGRVPGSVLVLTVNRAGTRVYTVNQDNTLHTYDLTAAPVNNNYPEIGTGSTVSVPTPSPFVPVRLEISPDGGTLFLAGTMGVVVIPAP